MAEKEFNPRFILELTLALLQLIVFFVIKLPFYYLETIYKKIVKDPPKSVKGEIVLITGTGHGIGKQLAVLYASKGATVVCWDINTKNNEGTVKLIQKLKYPKAYSYQCDVSKREEVSAVAKLVQQEVGHVSIIINNAGIMPCHSFFDHTAQEIEKIMNINVMAHFWILQSFLPSMKQKNHGHIVSISSVAGLGGARNIVPYCASKFAVVGYMEALRREFNDNPNNKVQFTTICPFMVDTGLVKKAVIKYQTLTKMLTPEQVAEKVFDGQTTNKSLVTIPAGLEYFGRVAKLWPERAFNDFLKTFETQLGSDM